GPRVGRSHHDCRTNLGERTMTTPAGVGRGQVATGRSARRHSSIPSASLVAVRPRRRAGARVVGRPLWMMGASGSRSPAFGPRRGGCGPSRGSGLCRYRIASSARIRKPYARRAVSVRSGGVGGYAGGEAFDDAEGEPVARLDGQAEGIDMVDG